MFCHSTSQMIRMRMPSFTCWTVSTLTWTSRAALWGSHSLTSPVLSTASGLLYLLTSWWRCWWILPLCPGLWTTSLADLRHCVSDSGQQQPTKDCPLSFPLHPLHHGHQLPDRVLPSSEVFWWLCRVRRPSSGLWWTTLSHGVNWTPCSSTQQKPKSWWWTWGEPGHQWPQFPSWGITWTLLNTTNIWGCTLTINWTGLRTLNPLQEATEPPLFSEEAPLL